MTTIELTDERTPVARTAGRERHREVGLQQRAVWALASLLVLYAAWQAGLFGESLQTAFVGDVFFVPLSLAAAAASFAAARRSGAVPRQRQGWLLFAVAFTFYAVGTVGQAAYEAAGMAPFPSPIDVLFLAVVPCSVAAVLRFPSPPFGRGEAVRYYLDLAAVCLAGGAVITYTVLADTISGRSEDFVTTAFAVAYPAGDLVLFFVVTALLVRGTLPSARRSLKLLTAGFVLYLLGDLAYAYTELHGGYSGGDLVDGFYLVALSLFTLAALAQRTTCDCEMAVPSSRRAMNILLSGAAATGFVLLVVSQRNDPVFPDLTLVAVAVAVACLALLRQFLARADLEQAHVELHAAHDAQRHAALHDALTGLPNRVLALDRAETLLARVRRSGGRLPLLFLDLDNFKYVNDSFGHAAGDRLLAIVGERLLGCVRAVDTVARFGGDEFVVLLDPDGMPEPERVAERIMAALHEPADINAGSGRIVRVTASIGIALGDGLVPGAGELLRQADVALYAAKGEGRDRAVPFDPVMVTTAEEHLAAELDLREAVAERQFVLHYQPVFRASSLLIVAVESLVRWNHPTRGLLPPSAFMSHAEESGLIGAIGRFALDESCRVAGEWQRLRRPLGVSVNVSGRQLDDSRIVEDVREALERHGVAPGSLMIEITETALMRDVERTKEVLLALKALGVRLAIDDFGTGYSSLGHVRELPVDTVKIDRSFVSGITEAPGSGAFAHTLIELAQAVGLATVAEGIETEAQLARLLREGCDFVQGFLLSKPLPLDELEALLACEGVDVAVEL
jgi:diguanylate cyclase